MQHRHERVYIETARHRITGCLTLPADGYRSRLSDFLNGSERDFVSLTDVASRSSATTAPEPRTTSWPSPARHIVLAIPESGLDGG